MILTPFSLHAEPRQYFKVGCIALEDGVAVPNSLAVTHLPTGYVFVHVGNQKLGEYCCKKLAEIPSVENATMEQAQDLGRQLREMMIKAGL